MKSGPASDPLLRPFRLKHLELRNRVLSTSHEPAYSEDGMPKRRYRLYHEEKARGGIALTMIGGSSLVAPDSPPAFGNLCLWDDAVVPYLQKLADGVHRHGAAVMCQITHLGRRTSPYTAHWLPPISASCVREPAHRAFPKEMEHADIRRVVKAYAEAARRCRDGQLDGVEIEAYGHLLDSFWSPATNRRRDEYGGSLGNRMRFALEVLEAIRRRVGEDYIVGIRMVVDEAFEGGLQFEEGMHIAQTLVQSGMLDFINVIRGHIDTDEGLSHVIPGMGTPSAPHLEFTSAVRSQLGLPVFHAARIQDVATARHAVATGCVDMVGMTRAHMADPHIVAKIERNEEHNIRPCVGASFCIDRIYVGEDALCLHNAATGREQTMPHVIPRARRAQRVVVVGAGPAGLEAARVSAERGHDVVLFEASDRPGGQIILAARVPRRRELAGIVDWLYAQLARLGVDIRLNTLASSEDVLAARPDVVVVATGGTPNSGFLRRGAELVTTTWDILSGHVSPGRSVLLYDDNGQHPGVSCAEFIAGRGAALELVTPDRAVGQEIQGTNYPAYLRCFYDKEVRMTPNLRLTGVRREGDGLAATLYNDYNKSTTERVVEQVVVEHGTLPADALYFELKPGSANLGEVDIDALLHGRPQGLAPNPDGAYRLFRIGDAVASRNIHAAVFDALRLCKDI